METELVMKVLEFLEIKTLQGHNIDYAAIWIINKIKQGRGANGDDEFKRKIGGNFQHLPAYDTKYHLKCYNKYIST